MKLLALLFIAMSAQAQMIFPRIVTFPNQAQLTISNYTQDDQRCSGSVFIYHMSGRADIKYYFGNIYKGMTDYEYYYNFNRQDPYRNAHHSITCTAY